MLEAPSGDLIPESGILVNFALETAPRDQGINLIPSDPLVAADMRARMDKHDKTALSPLF